MKPVSGKKKNREDEKKGIRQAREVCRMDERISDDGRNLSKQFCAGWSVLMMFLDIRMRQGPVMDVF
jgi:hypothetical protein